MTQETVNLPLRWGETYTMQDCDDWREYLDLEEFRKDSLELRSKGWIPLDPRQKTQMEKTFYDVDQKQPGMTPMLKVVYILGHVHPEAIQGKRFVPASLIVPQNQPRAQESRKVEYPVKWRKPCGEGFNKGGCGREVVRIIWSEGAKKVWYELDEKTEHKCPGPDRA